MTGDDIMCRHVACAPYVGVVLLYRAGANVKTTKISSEASGGGFAKLCTCESFPLCGSSCSILNNGSRQLVDSKSVVLNSQWYLLKAFIGNGVEDLISDLWMYYLKIINPLLILCLKGLHSPWNVDWPLTSPQTIPLKPHSLNNTNKAIDCKQWTGPLGWITELDYWTHLWPQLQFITQAIYLPATHWSLVTV